MNWPFNMYIAYVANCIDCGVEPQSREWWDAACRMSTPRPRKSDIQHDYDELAVEMGDRSL